MSSTICAIATATGGAIGIVRLSGSQSFTILRRVCPRIKSDTPPRSAILTPITTTEGELLDEAIVILYPAPHSYTGADCAEISCHGSRYILNKVLELLVQHGAQLAQPGEFTLRAYLNGKLDLSQAEAVADLIASSNHATHQMAMSQLKGHFSSELHQLRDQLLHLTSLLELELDFSDHEDLEFADRAELLSLAQTIDQRITRLADSFQTGNALKNGIPVAIVGAPNVGKSTLLNTLLGEERAIVSDIQGTTRDAIEDTIQLAGITFRFIDTAGIRHTDDKIENLGIERSIAAAKHARIILMLTEPGVPFPDIHVHDDQTVIYIENKVDVNKSDIIEGHPSDTLTPPASSGSSDIIPSSASIPAPASIPSPTSTCTGILRISAKYGVGIDELQNRIISAAPKTADSDVIVTSARHYEALLRAHDSLTRVLEGLAINLSGDLLAEDLRLTLSALADITGGAITPQETLNNIFSHFCVGK